jgi:hypothetical protein
VNRSDEQVLEFISASFPSVWALELLLALRRDRRIWSCDELVATLRASDLVVNKAVAALVAAGLASIEGEGVRYSPVTDEVDRCVARVEILYLSRPNRVRRAIMSRVTNSAAAFADAFRLRVDGNE